MHSRFQRMEIGLLPVGCYPRIRRHLERSLFAVRQSHDDLIIVRAHDGPGKGLPGLVAARIRLAAGWSVLLGPLTVGVTQSRTIVPVGVRSAMLIRVRPVGVRSA